VNGRPLALAICVAIAASGCGDDDDSEKSATPTTDTTATVAAPERSKPRVRVPEAPPPKKLVTRDLIEGKGDAARSGDQVTVQYVGVDYKTGKQFDASWDRREPFPFQLGAGQVIPGWDEGVEGMRAGGRRELIIPPRLAYGRQGQPPAIRPNATLVFVVDLVRID
jgi:peptidylprolyl isomerase